jgi:hypothetical protein
MAQDLIAETKTIEPTFAKRLNDLPKDWNKVIDSSVLLAEKQLLFAKKVKELCLEAKRIDAKKDSAIGPNNAVESKPAAKIVKGNFLKISKIKKVNPVNTTIPSAIACEKIRKKGIA